MQSEIILILFLIFIILIGLVVLIILYIQYTSKYDKSNTFYKNLLEIIKKNPNLSNNLEDKLFEKDFDINDISDSEKELSNIFGAKIYSEAQLNTLNQSNINYVDTELNTLNQSNINYVDTELNSLKDTNEYKYLKNSYTIINDNNDLSNIYNYSTYASEFTSNLNSSYIFFDGANNINANKYINMLDSIEILNTSNIRYDGILGNDQQLCNLYSFYNIDNNEISLDSTKTFKINIDSLKLCKDDNCSNLSFSPDGNSINLAPQ